MTRWTLRAALSVAVTVLTLVSAACSGSDDSPRDQFLKEMVPHHESAVLMADVALERAEHPEIKQLAQAIKQDQTREIAEMNALLGDKAGKSAGGGHGGMAMGTGQSEVDTLRMAQPFDQAFIDMMIPHHEAAITMANDVKGKTKDAQITKLADGIIAAQQAEITQMKAWRVQWYGG